MLPNVVMLFLAGLLVLIGGFFGWTVAAIVATTVFMAIVVLLAFAIPRAMERERRQRLGLCPRCGYDHRATPGRCTECGAVFFSPRSERRRQKRKTRGRMPQGNAPALGRRTDGQVPGQAGAKHGSVVALVAMTLVSSFVVQYWFQTWMVGRGGTGSVVAEVTEISSRHGKPMVRYRFQVPGSPTWYTYRGWLGLDGDAPRGVPQPVGQQARLTGKIEVVYSRSDPRWNLPANVPAAERGVEILMSVLFGGPTVILWINWVVRRRRRDPIGVEMTAKPLPEPPSVDRV